MARYEGAAFKFSTNKLTSDDDRMQLLSRLPENNTLGLLDSYNVARSSRLLNDKNRSLKNIIDQLSVSKVKLNCV